MGEIKFRGKRVDNENWVYGYYYTEITGFHLSQGSMPGVDGTPMVAHYIKDFDGDDFEVDPKTVGQFTGRHDKNGKEIYGGSLVKNNTGRICRVVWFESPSFTGWDLKPVNAKGLPPQLSHIWDGWEVIGNTHENSDLLTT